MTELWRQAAAIKCQRREPIKQKAVHNDEMQTLWWVGSVPRD
jgi:hypothetical protein